MILKKITSIALIIIIITTVIINLKQKEQHNTTPNIKILSSRKVYVGAWVGGFWENDTKTLNTPALTDFELLTGKKVAIANIYSEWTYLSNKNLINTLNNISSHGWTPMISSNPFFFDSCPQKNESLYKTISDGYCDKFLETIGVNLRSYGKPILLRFAWEMNLPDMYWSVTKLKSNPQEFINAWKHFHKILKKENANNVMWVLSFNTSSSETIPYSDLYPGDDYVDWVALDGYNWGDTQNWSTWTTFNDVFRNSYDELTAITHKPIMLSEVNSASTGGNKTSWLHDMLVVQIPEKFPLIEAVIFFNEDKTKVEHVDWKIEKSPDYISVVKDALNNKIYKSSLP